MNLNIDEISATRKRLVISISGSEVAAEEKRVLGQFARRVSVPGFRPGKAPPALIQRKHGKDMAEELKRSLVSKAYDKAVKESKLDISTVVGIDEGDFSSDGDSKIVLTVDITPQFEIPEYKGIPTEVPPDEVSDDEVDHAIEEVRRQRADFKVVERPAGKGDFVRVTYRGRCEGKPIAELAPQHPLWGTQENTWEEVGADPMVGVAPVIEALVGMNAGETKEVDHQFAAEFEVTELAGKSATYSIEVQEVRERLLPEIDESFLKNLNVESRQQLRSNVSEDLEARKQRLRRDMQRRQILDALDRKIEFPLPESLLDRETQAMIREIMEQQMRRGVPEEEFENHKEELFENARRSAAQRLKTRTLLSRIAEEESIEVENEDMQAFLLQEAMRTRSQPKQLLNDLQKNRDRLRDIQTSILMNKTLDFLVEQATVTVTENPG